MYLLESLQTRGSQSGNRLTIPGENGIIGKCRVCTVQYLVQLLDMFCCFSV